MKCLFMSRFLSLPRIALCFWAITVMIPLRLWAADQTAMDKDYKSTIQPLLQKYCFDCHAGDVTEAEIDLAAFGTMDQIRKDAKTWVKVRQMLDSGQMPPKNAARPTDEEYVHLKTWVRAFLTAEAKANAGDPGPVVLRRLSNAEYNYTLRDLTGVQTLDPTREFPVDGAAGEGFTNTGSGQGMSPALLQKYLDAAKEVAAHAVLLPDDVRFSPFTTPRDQTDELLAKIQGFYRQFTEDGEGMPINLQGIQFNTNQGGLLPLKSYLLATIAEREALLAGQKTIEQVAKERSLNAKYLGHLWNQLTADKSDPSSFLLNSFRTKWQKATPEDVPALYQEIAEAQKILWKFNTVGHIGRQGSPKSWMEAVSPIMKEPEQQNPMPAAADENSLAALVLGHKDDQNRDKVEAALDEFRNLFPPALCYARIVPVDEVVTLTLFYREDDHLKRLMLDEKQSAELDRLWEELFYISQEPLKTVVAFEQISEFATQDRPDLVDAFAPMRKPIQDRAEAFRERLVKAEPAQVESVLQFADRAWRRPLHEAEQQKLREFYQSLRRQEIPHEEALRLLLARVLTAPAFLYKLEQPALGTKAAPVSQLELASRLSYFLWSSAPDEELRRAGEAGVLSDEKVLLAQTKRMLKDAKSRRLAVEFACQWLHVRDFDQNDDKNETLYPEFANLKDDMHEETVRFFADMIQNDGQILDILNADHTFLNEALAKHYGISGITGDDWQRVENIKAKSRGGVLGMATVLASQSGASRTSPILRGNWVYETLLGERLPRPPANVPVLPDDVPQGLTERQLIERHSSDPACAKCHVQIDPYGFSLEQFDAIGRQRLQKMDTKTTLPNGQTIEGLNGLRDYLLQERQDDVVRQFCRKLLGFALGRELQLSDEPLLSELEAKLKANGFRFYAAVETIVLSPQFQTIRGREMKDE